MSSSAALSLTHWFSAFLCLLCQHLPGPVSSVCWLYEPALMAFVIALRADKAKPFQSFCQLRVFLPLSLPLSLSSSLSLCGPHFKCPFVQLYTCYALIFPCPPPSPCTLHSFVTRVQHCGRLTRRLRNNVLRAAQQLVRLKRSSWQLKRSRKPCCSQLLCNIVAIPTANPSPIHTNKTRVEHQIGKLIRPTITAATNKIAYYNWNTRITRVITPFAHTSPPAHVAHLTSRLDYEHFNRFECQLWTGHGTW